MSRTIHTLFFSPTHSSREIARTLADGLAVSLGGHQKIRDLTFPPEREESLDCAPGDVLVFAFPVYAGRVPQLLETPLARVRGNGAAAVVAAVYGNRDYDDALLEAGDSFRPVDGLRVRAQRRENIDEDRGAADTQLHAFHIFGFFDRAFAGG